MSQVLIRIVEASLRHPRRVIALHVFALLLAFSALGVHLRRTADAAPGNEAGAVGLAIFDNSLERIWGEAPLADYRAFQNRYGSDEVLVLAVHGAGPFPAAALDHARTFTRGVEAMDAGATPGHPSAPAVVWAGSLPYAPESLAADATEAVTDADLATFLAVAAKDPSASRIVRVAADGWDMALTVALPPLGRDDARRLALSKEIAARWQATAPPTEWSSAVTGGPALLGAIRDASFAAIQDNLPLVNLLVVGICLAVYRRARVVLPAVVALAQGEALVLAVFLSGGHAFNYISGFMATCIVVVGFATNMHLFARYCAERRTMGVREAILTATRTVALPSTVSVVTSCIAFLSMATAEHTALVDFGVYSAVGVLTVLGSAFTLAPTLLLLVDARDVPEMKRGLWLPDPTRWSMAAWDHAPKVTAAFGVASVLAVVAVSQMQFGSDVRESFVAGSDVRTSLDTVADRFGGVQPYEVDVRWPAGSAPVDGAALLDRVTAMEGAVLGAVPGLADRDVMDAADLARSFCLVPGKESLCTADSRPLPDTARALIENAEPPAGMRYYSHDDAGYQARLTVFLDFPRSAVGEERAAKIAAAVQNIAGSDATVSITGLTVQWGALETSVTSALAVSFAQGVGVLVAGLLLLAVIRRERGYVVGVLCYGMPLLLVAGGASWVANLVGYHANSSVMMYLTVAEGIIVDETLFLMLGFQATLKEVGSARTALHHTIAEAGDGVVLTSLSLALGFLTLLTAHITNIQVMGLLTAITIVVALVGNVILLPALLRMFWNVSPAASVSPTSASPESSHASAPLRLALDAFGARRSV